MMTYKQSDETQLVKQGSFILHTTRQTHTHTHTQTTRKPL